MVYLFMSHVLGYETNNFSQMALLAKGCDSWVYYAYLANEQEPQEAVIKKLDLSIDHDSDDDFQAQLSVLYTLEHEHLTELLGVCIEEDTRCLVYEYASLGSLHDILYGRKGLEGAEPGPVLTWAQRTKIAYGAAKGLEYLHEKVTPSIVHGDVRSSNVLVFDDFKSKIADFKLTNALTDDNAARTISTRAPGSYGYDAPECATTGEITEKGDVYSFGVVLLEMLTGRKPVDDTLPEEQQDLVTWAIPYLCAENVEQIVDPKLNRDFSLDEVAKVAEIAGLCIQDEIDSRPNMSTVVSLLETLVEV